VKRFAYRIHGNAPSNEKWIMLRDCLCPFLMAAIMLPKLLLNGKVEDFSVWGSN